MTIAFQCSGCRHPFRVPDKLAGQRGKCPKCATINLIPPAGQIQAAVPPSKPAAARKAQPVEPDVLEPDVVEEDEEEAAPPPRQRARRAAAEEEAEVEELEEVEEEVEKEAEEEAEERPRKRAKKNNKKSNKKQVKRRSPLLLIGLLGGFAFLLLLGGIGGLAWWWFSASSGEEIKFLPSNTQMIVSARVDQLLKSEAWKELKGAVPQLSKADEGEIEKGLGIPASNIDRMLIGASFDKPNEFTLVVRTKEAVKADDIKAKLKKSNHNEVKVGKYTMHEAKDALGDSPSFCVVERKLVVYGDRGPLQAVLQRDKKPDFSPAMQSAIKQVDFARPLVLLMDIGAARKAVSPIINMMAPKNDFPKSFEKVDSLLLQGRVSADVQLDLTLLCRDAQGAADIKKLFDEAVAAGRNDKKTPKELADMLNVNFKVEGNNVTGSLTLKIAPLVKAFKQQMGKF